jgi:hypothetical protein
MITKTTRAPRLTERATMPTMMPAKSAPTFGIKSRIPAMRASASA